MNDVEAPPRVRPHLGLVQSPTAAAGERRTDDRAPASGSVPATLFLSSTEDVPAVIADTGQRGAGARVPRQRCPKGLTTGEQVTVCIQTPERSLTRRAEVRWVRADANHVRLGMRFLAHLALEPENHQLHLDKVRVDPRCALRIPGGFAIRRRVLPFLNRDGTVHVACADPDDHTALGIVERHVKSPVTAWKVPEDVLDATLADVYGDSSNPASGNRMDAAGDDTAVASSVGDDLLYAAYLRRASDVHINPGREGVQVRMRVDGTLETYANYPLALLAELINRYKVLAGLDIAEKRAPQDGRFAYDLDGDRRVDIRVATLPSKYGERMTLRVLALQTGSLTLGRLGLEPDHLRVVEEFLRRSQGMMIMTGPTGSGKTTTLYAAIRMLLGERAANVMTIEDPIEYAIDGVTQCEVDSADKVSFGKAMRSILRHDPDVVMIGEVRDQETADIAMKAALTGHLVLGTLHTNSAAASVTRLLDMGLEPYLVAATLRLVIAQRLVRRLCTHCRIDRPLTAREAMALQDPSLAGETVYEPGGCIYCADRGFVGRIGVYELLELDADLARGIAEGKGEMWLMSELRAKGARLLMGDARRKLLEGEIPVTDALRVAASW